MEILKRCGTFFSLATFLFIFQVDPALADPSDNFRFIKIGNSANPNVYMIQENTRSYQWVDPSCVGGIIDQSAPIKPYSYSELERLYDKWNVTRNGKWRNCAQLARISSLIAEFTPRPSYPAVVEYFTLHKDEPELFYVTRHFHTQYRYTTKRQWVSKSSCDITGINSYQTSSWGRVRDMGNVDRLPHQRLSCTEMLQSLD